MYLQIPSKNFNQSYVLFTINDQTGQLVDMNITRLSEMLMLSDGQYGPDDVFLTVRSIHTDPMILANDALTLMDQLNDKRFQDRIKLTLHSMGKKRQRQILCNETGETFSSVYKVCMAHGGSPSAMYHHMNGTPGYKSVKGKSYRYVG